MHALNVIVVRFAGDVIVVQGEKDSKREMCIRTINNDISVFVYVMHRDWIRLINHIIHAGASTYLLIQ